MWQPRALAVAQCLTTEVVLQLSLPDFFSLLFFFFSLLAGQRGQLA